MSTNWQVNNNCINCTLTKVQAKREQKPKVEQLLMVTPCNGPCAFGQVYLDLMVDLVVVDHLLHMGVALVMA